ncbi:helix-turn-helix domain-containing protein [Bacillus cereus]|nr:helix-turn-helix domain-containing protein [Bacillus cereus]
MRLTEREKLTKKIENHLRITARQLVKFDTEEETLQYLIESFRSKLACDLVGMILKEGDYLIPKVWSGGSDIFGDSFPLKIDKCSLKLLSQGLAIEKSGWETTCELAKLLLAEKIQTWFTVPLKDEENNFGFCIIGFLNSVPLFMEMDKPFVDFGKDIAVAIALAKRKEAQKKTMIDVEWISKNLFSDSSIEEIVEKIVERAGKETNATVACIYLYHEKENCFSFQPPSYGKINQSKKIITENNYMLKEYFPFLEISGGSQLTVPLVVNLKTIGVLHVENKNKDVFTNEDLEVLELLSSHVAAMLENVRLYMNEKEHKQRLHSLLNFQQALVKETVDQNNFDGITTTLSKVLLKSVVLLDRFLRPISYHLFSENQAGIEEIVECAIYQIIQEKNRDAEFSFENTSETKIGFWQVRGGGDLLGYLIIELSNDEVDDFHRISIDSALNVFSIQFIKQKLVLDTREQVKDSFIHKLLVERIEDQETILQYANVFNWDLFNQHRISILSIALDETGTKDSDILEQQAQKSLLWEQLKTQISIVDRDILLANKGDEHIMFVPVAKEKNHPKNYWANLYGHIKRWIEKEELSIRVFLGVGGKTEKLQDYYTCYQQAIQAHRVVSHRFNRGGVALFDELGVYTVLHYLKDSSVATLFIKKHLEPLLHYSEGKNTDLFQTLRVYLHHNGSLKETSQELYIHRSTLQYRIEKIQNLLEVDLDYSEHRLNLMMAFKLYDLYYKDSSKKLKM